MTERADHLKGQRDRAHPGGRAGDGVTHPRAGAAELSQLADAIARRDQAALGRLYDLMGSRAFGLAITVTGDSTSAEDAVQEAFLSLWKRAESVSSSRGRVESLLLTMVHRRAVDHVRRRARADRFHGEADADRLPPVEGDPEQMAVDASEREVAHRALRRLPDEQALVIRLAYFRGLTQREIADVTGVSLGTVKGRMRLGMEKLRTAFGANEEAGDEL